MDLISLNPSYSIGEIPGKCIKCLAEGELFGCLRILLLEGERNGESARKYEMLLEFLKSPEARKLRDESERLLAEGKEVSVELYVEAGKPEYRLKVR